MRCTWDIRVMDDVSWIKQKPPWYPTSHSVIRSSQVEKEGCSAQINALMGRDALWCFPRMDSTERAAGDGKSNYTVHSSSRTAKIDCKLTSSAFDTSNPSRWETVSTTGGKLNWKKRKSNKKLNGLLNNDIFIVARLLCLINVCLLLWD